MVEELLAARGIIVSHEMHKTPVTSGERDATRDCTFDYYEKIAIRPLLADE